MPFDYSGAVAMADEMITNYGARAILRRSLSDSIAPGDRDCIACEIEYTPTEQQGKLANRVQRLFLVSTFVNGVPLSPLPNHERDTLVTLVPETYNEEDEVLEIIQPVGKLKPAQVPVYCELFVKG